MNTKLVLTAAAALAFCPTLHAQTAPVAPALPATPAAPASSPVTLRYKFAAGQVHRYEYDMDMAMNLFGCHSPVLAPLPALASSALSGDKD